MRPDDEQSGSGLGLGSDVLRAARRSRWLDGIAERLKRGGFTVEDAIEQATRVDTKPDDDDQEPDDDE